MRQTICALKSLGLVITAGKLCTKEIETRNILTQARLEGASKGIGLTREMTEALEITVLGDTGIKLKDGYYV